MLIPVSYTHLDVYKRQVPTTARFPAAELWTDNIVDIKVFHIYNTSVFHYFFLYSVLLVVTSPFTVLPLHCLCHCDILVCALYNLPNQTLTWAASNSKHVPGVNLILVSRHS